MLYNGAKSRSFLEEGWQLITLERLFQNFFGKSLYKSMYAIYESDKRLEYLVTQVERMTGLKNYGIYLNKLFTIDAFFLNEDRHTHNIAVLMNEKGEYAYCPIFDNGAGLLADTTLDYPLQEDIYTLMKESHAKTISMDYDEQLDVSEMLYKENLKFYFTKKDVQELLKEVNQYSDEIKYRVETIIYMQMKKYAYLFSK